MLQSAAARLLPPAHKAAQDAIARADDAGAQWDVLTATAAAEALERAAEAERRGLRVRAADLALRLIVAKLEAIPAGAGTLDDLLKVVAGLDPASRQSAGQVVAVQVIVQDERGG